MKGRLVIIGWIAVMLMAPAFLGWSLPSDTQNTIAFQLRGAETAQTGYSGVIPMDLSVMVGDSGNEMTDAFNYLAAVPFTIRSNRTHTASGLLLPDDIENYASPLNEWIEFLGGSMNELVFIGNVQNTDHTALTSIADTHHTITGSNHVEMAANLASEFFVGARSVVLAEAPILNQFSSSEVLYDTSSTLSSMSTRTQSGTTSSSNDWEWTGGFTPFGGGAIIRVSGGDEFTWFDLLSHEGGEYYPVDFPYYDGITVMCPYQERSGATLTLHLIDLYPSSRTVSCTFNIEEPDADFYSFTIPSDQDCRIDFDLSVVGGVPRNIGLNVLGPSGDLILSGNRYALMKGINEVSDISVSLSHPQPGEYRAYVFAAEDSSTSYDLTITKNVLNPEYEAAAASAANGASLASLLGAPLLYTSDGSLDAVTLNAINAVSPQTVYFMSPTGNVDPSIESELESLAFTVHNIENFTQVQSLVSALSGRSSSQGSVILYDSVETSFAAAGLSGAQRRAPAIPFSYGDSNVMSISQIPEQINWNQEYQMPLVATVSLLDIFTDDIDFSGMNPPVSTMTAIADSFFSWLSQQVGVNTVDDVITIAPYYGPGQTLPPSFDRALTGKADVGRYSSVDTSATLVQIMRSILRIPLMSLPSRSHEALGSYLVYSYIDSIMNNNYQYSTIDNSNDFPTLVSSAGLTSVMQVGPSTISELADAPYAWVATIHGATGTDLYEYDGQAALFDTNTWRAYDDGWSASNPDADTEESPYGVVNPSHSNLLIYDIGDLFVGTNLRGMFAFLDSCQIGSSYGPSMIMERGADAVVACRTDTLVGPADMVEYNVLSNMVDSAMSLGAALDDAFGINSHRYAPHDIGKDTYVSVSDAAMIGASCLQFIIFGDPDVTIYDWDATPFPIMERTLGIGPSHSPRAYPGSTYQLPLGMHDPVGNIYASDGTYEVRVYDTQDNLLTSGTAISTSSEMGHFEIQFSESATLGIYNLEITDTGTNETFYNQIILEWPNLEIQSIVSSSYVELGTWQIDISVYNPQDVVAETTVQISLNNEILLVADASWTPGYSSNRFEMMLLFGHAGDQILNVLITIGSQSTECCNYNTPLFVIGHWVSPVLLYVIPALGIAVVISGLYTRRLGSKVATLQEAMEAEKDGNHEKAFDMYGKNRLTRAATRIAVKEDLPEKMMGALMHYYGDQVRVDLQSLAAQTASEGDYAKASRIYLLLNQNDRGLHYKALTELEDGSIDEAVQTFRDILSNRLVVPGLEVIRHLESMDEKTQSTFVELAKDDILSFANALQNQEVNQVFLLSMVEGHVEEDYLVKFLMNIRQVDEVAQKIFAKETIPKMAALTKVLETVQQETVVPIVVRLMLPTIKLKQIAKYITSVEINDRAKETAVSPILEKLILEPGNKERIAALQTISKSSSAGSLRIIDEAIEAVNSMITAAEGVGVSPDAFGSAGLVPVIAGLQDRALADKLLKQTERQVLSGSVPASASIDALAEYVYGLRSAVYGVADVHPQVPLKLRSYQDTLQNRISSSIQEAVMASKLQLDGSDWLEVSSNAIAEKILTSVPLADSLSVVKGCFRALSHASSRLVLECLRNSIDLEKQTEAANTIMNDPLQRDRILRKHMKLRVDEYGRSAWVPDEEAAFADVLSQVLGEWKPQATQAISVGLFKTARNVAVNTAESQVPARELVDVSVEFLFGARSVPNLGEEEIIAYLRILQRYLDRDVVAQIVGKTRWPATLMEEL